MFDACACKVRLTRAPVLQAEEPEDFDIADEEEGVEGGIGSVLGKRKEGDGEDGADPL